MSPDQMYFTCTNVGVIKALADYILSLGHKALLDLVSTVIFSVKIVCAQGAFHI